MPGRETPTAPPPAKKVKGRQAEAEGFARGQWRERLKLRLPRPKDTFENWNRRTRECYVLTRSVRHLFFVSFARA